MERVRRNGLSDTTIVLLMSALMLLISFYYAVGAYFSYCGIEPGVFYLEHDLGYRKGREAERYISNIIRTTFSHPVYLKLYDRLYILRLGEHFTFEPQEKRILKLALDTTAAYGTWERLLHLASANYPRRDLSFDLHVDRQRSTASIKRLLKDVASVKIYARWADREHGVLELTESNPDKAIGGILDRLEESINRDPFCDYRLIECTSFEKEGITTTTSLAAGAFMTTIATAVVDYDPLDTPLTHDIVLTCKRLDGTIINPSHLFSFDEIVGPRDEEHGFKKTAVFEGEQIRYSYERGCEMTASAIYRILLQSGISLVERHHHPVFTKDLSYTTPGFDVALETGKKDLKFLNELDFPLMIRCSAEQGRITAVLSAHGRLPYRVKVVPGRLYKTNYDTTIIRDPSLRNGLEVIERRGVEGYEIKIFRHYYNSRNVLYKEELVGDTPNYYFPRKAIIRIGTSSSPPRSSRSGTERAPGEAPSLDLLLPPDAQPSPQDACDEGLRPDEAGASDRNPR